MPVRNAIAIAAAMLLLDGCTIPIPEQGNEIDYGNGALPNESNAADVVQSADSGSGGGTGSGTGAIIIDGRIPAAFLGRWGLVPADCTSTAGDNKGLMTVEPDRLSFYESRASIAKLEGISPTELRATLAFSGEGQEWTQETPLILENDGAALTRVADGQTLRYTRCGA
jgi:hypothetical protein